MNIKHRVEIPLMMRHPQAHENSVMNGIELGVAKGDFAEELKKRYPNLFLWGVDRYADHHDDAEYSATVKRMAWWSGYALLRMSFEQAASHFSDQSFDFVYIDGYAHTGQEGGRTLAQWFPKVRRGGVFAGHDYHPQYQATKDAVDEFAKVTGRQIHLTTGDEFPSWWMIR